MTVSKPILNSSITRHTEKLQRKYAFSFISFVAASTYEITAWNQMDKWPEF